MPIAIQEITSENFVKYGRVIESYDFAPLIQAMAETPLPQDTVYVPSDPALEKLAVFEELSQGFYGGMPIQIGYCNGNNRLLNGLEYHRGSEVNIACGTDLILLLGSQQDICWTADGCSYDSAKVEAFRLPEGVAVEMYATTLHYAPCNSGPDGFRCVVALPKDTNTELAVRPVKTVEDKLLVAKNKWLLLHPDVVGNSSGYAGITGENISV